MAPPGFEAFTGPHLGVYGGNLDYNGTVSGTTMLFPVFHPGALFGFGDGHAAMADGEVTQTGLEVSMDVTFSVVVPNNYRLTLPAGVTRLGSTSLSNNDLPLHNFGPRVRFAWQPFGSGSSTVEASASFTPCRRRDGMMVDVEVYGIPLMVDVKLAGVYALYQDVTERNKAQMAFREISGQLENLQQEERRRLARDLHDSTSQELAVLNWNLTRLMNLVGDRDEALKTLVQQTKEIAYECSARIRSVAYLLHPPLLGEAGLTQAVPWLAEGFEQRSGIRVTLDMSTDLGRCRDEIEIAVFRIVQEGLANVLRHSRSPVAKISLHREARWLELAVSDQGKGYAREALMRARDRRNGIGISGMRTVELRLPELCVGNVSRLLSFP